MKAILFPGQGSQSVGMGSEFYNNFSIAKKIFTDADNKLGFKLSKIILNGPEEELKLTKFTQPAILTVSYTIFSILKKEFEFDSSNIKFLAGHSLGEYSALVCSDSLNFLDALYLVYERGKSMQEAVPVGKGLMIAVLGVSSIDLKKMLTDFKLINKKGICEIANDNAEGQIILSGDFETVNLFKEYLKKKGQKFIPLKVSAPFHCKLMEPAAEYMKDKINQTQLAKPNFEVISNVSARKENNPEIIKKNLINQISSTVRWRETLIEMKNQNINTLIEIGPGKVLTGMVKRTLKDINSFSINSINDIKDYLK